MEVEGSPSDIVATRIIYDDPFWSNVNFVVIIYTLRNGEEFKVITPVVNVQSINGAKKLRIN